jgi:ABC-type polysaccharide/polyol phosphate export permease
MNKKITIYSPNDRLNLSVFRVFKNIFQEIKSHKWQIWIAFKKDFINSYNHTAIGFIWSIILPLIPISAYVLLAQFRILKTTDNMPFIVYILIGFTIWFFLTNTITTIMNSLRREKGILTKIKYPLSAVILSHFGKLIFDLLVRIIFSSIILILYNIHIGLHLLLLVFLLIPLIIFSFGIGLILLVLSEIYRDITNFIDIFFRYGMFISSVIFPMPNIELIQKINLFNPFNTYIVNIREFIVFGNFTNIELFLYTSLFSLVIFIISVKFMYIMENRLKAYL